MPDVVIQIVSYKSKIYLPGCLNSILLSLEDSDISFKITVLENGSGEDLSDLEKKYAGRPISFYKSEKNLGFGAGHNVLAEKESGKYLFALNPDTVVVKGAIKALVDFMEQHPKAGLCGPRIDEPLGFWHHKPTFWPRQFIIKSFCERFLRIKILRDVHALEYVPIVGSALFFRRAAFDEIGGFDEHLFLYFEEGDICNSLTTHRWKTFFVYDALVTHFYRKSHEEPGNAEIFARSKEYFYKKWPQGMLRP